MMQIDKNVMWDFFIAKTTKWRGKFVILGHFFRVFVKRGRLKILL